MAQFEVSGRSLAVVSAAALLAVAVMAEEPPKSAPVAKQSGPASGAATAGPVAAQTFRDQASVVVIEVPVEVTIDGQPARGLTKDRFVLEVDGKKVPIEGFEEVDLCSESTPTLEATGGRLAQAPPVAGRRRILFLFDLSHNSVAAITKARESAEEVLSKLAPSDLVGVGTYSRAKGMSLLLHYSPDRAQVAESLALLGKGQPMAGRDPLKMLVRFDGANSLGYASDKTSTLTVNPKEEIQAVKMDVAGGWAMLQAMIDQSQVSQLASETIDTYKQMEQLGELCRSVGGRKHVVFFSAGLDDDVLAGTSDQQRRTNISRTANESGELWKVDSEEYFGSTQAANSLESLVETLRRGECVVHTVDTSGLRAGGTVERNQQYGSSGLLALADGTGGSYLENFNNFEVAVAQMLERTRVSYLLSFTPPPAKANGKFHKIEVDVNGLPGKARLTHRPGYFSPDAKNAPTAVSQVLDLGARLFDDRRPGELTVRGAAWTWVQAERKPLRHVPLVVELDAPAGAAGITPIDLLVYAFDADGNARDVLAQRFNYDPAAGASGLKAMLPVLLPPGDYVLRILAREPASGRTGLAVLPLEVPSAARALLIPEEVGAWQIARTTRQDTLGASSHPFAFGESFFAPALIASIETPGALPLVAIGLKADKARLLDDHQKEIADIELGDERINQGADGIERIAFQAKLPPLAPGAYRLEVDGVQVPFRVVPSPPTSHLIDMTLASR